MSSPLRSEVRQMISEFAAGSMSERVLTERIVSMLVRPPYPGPFVQNLGFAFAAGIDHLDADERRRLVDALTNADPRLGDIVARIGSQQQSTR